MLTYGRIEQFWMSRYCVLTNIFWNMINSIKDGLKCQLPPLSFAYRFRLCMLWDEKAHTAIRGVPFAGRVRAKVYDITVFVYPHRLEQPEREMWTWLGDSPSRQIQSDLDSISLKSRQWFVTWTTFHWIEQTDRKLVRVSQQLVNRPRLASYWKFNISLLDIGDFQERLETLIQQALEGAVTGNKWWGSLKYWIRDFVIKYDRQLKLDRAKKTKSSDDRLSRGLERGGPKL